MREKKIGILTFSYSSNPGSVLQAYSLQQNISKKEGLKAHIINYQKTSAGKPVIGKTVFFGPLKKWTPRLIIEWIARIIAHPVRMHRYEKFFNRHYCGFSRKPVTRDDLNQIEKRYDCFVVGSDQVWNYGSCNVDETYFLDFVNDNKKKISYAASFGQSRVPENKIDEAKKLISDFAAVSVRERYGVEIVSELSGKKAEWVLDPSLLTDKEEYRKLEKAPARKKYVFVYLREDSKEITEYAKKLAEFHNLEVVKVVKHWMYGKNDRPIYAVGPEKWLGYMDNASYIVTNSFHGICFSIIFEKEFFVGLLKKVSVVTNPRISEVLKLFEIEGRYIDEIYDFSKITPLDYVRINENKETRKRQSIEYLYNAIERSVN
ncbi:MAG: polysaccharide pyruvyl transferase family protein [Oscillospiraceae bacterium]|nr:polysaccharide pyruvyl transferase family protein [Oscillospiraceae bacterium]